MAGKVKVYCPHVQDMIDVEECYFCFDKHGGFKREEKA